MDVHNEAPRSRRDGRAAVCHFVFQGVENVVEVGHG